MPWAAGDTLTSANLNTKVPSWSGNSGTLGAVRYVKTTANGGSNSNDGLSWATAKATIAAAVASLPTDGTSHHGLIEIGDGTFVEAGDLEFNWGIEYRGIGTSSGVGGGTVIQLANSANKWLFTPTATWLSDILNYGHHLRMRNCRLDGNEVNQTHPTTVSGVNMTFSNGPPPTITRASGSWTTDGYQAGDYVEVRGDTNGNDGMYEVASIDSATVLRLWDTSVGSKRIHEVIASGPTSGITIVGMRYGLVRIQNGGFNCFFDNVLFEDSRIGVLQIGSALNLDFWRCSASTLTCRWILFRSYGNVMVNVHAPHVDASGRSSIEIHRNHTGAGHIWNFFGGKWEATVANDHRHLILSRPMENGSGSPYSINCIGLQSLHTIAPGADDYMFYESPIPAVGAEWNLIGCHGGGNYAGLFKSALTGRILNEGVSGASYGPAFVDGNSSQGVSASPTRISKDVTLALGNVTYDLASDLARPNVLRVTGDAGASSLIGISGGYDGRELRLIFLDGNVTVVNQSGSASAANRIIVGSNFAAGTDDVVDLQYDGTTQRWRTVTKQVI